MRRFVLVLVCFLMAGMFQLVSVGAHPAKADSQINWSAMQLGLPLVMELDKSEVPYLGTSSGVYVYKNNQWSMIPGSQKLGIVRAIQWTRSQKLVVAARGVWEYQGSKWSLVGGTESIPADKNILALTITPTDQIIASVEGGEWEGGGVYSYSDKDGQWNILGGEKSPTFAMKLGISPKGVITAGVQVDNGVMQYINGKWETLGGTQSPVKGQVNAMTWSPSGVLTVATSPSGVYSYNYSTTKWSKIDNNSPFVRSWLNYLSYNSKNVLIAGSLSGVWQFSGNKWAQIDEAHSPVRLETVMIAKWKKDGSIIAGTYNGEFYLFAKNKWTLMGKKADSITESFHSKQQAAIFQGKLTIGARGVWQLGPSGWKQLGTGQEVAQSFISVLRTDPKGILTAGTDRGIWQLQNGKWVKVGKAASSTSNFKTTVINWSPQGVLTAGTSDKGVMQYNKGNWEQLGGRKSPLINVEISEIGWVQGNLVTATNVKGLWQYTKGKWSSFGPKLADPNNTYINSIAFGKDFLVLSIGGGVYIFKNNKWEQQFLADENRTAFTASSLAISSTGDIAASDFMQGVYVKKDNQWVILGDANSSVHKSLITHITWLPNQTLIALTYHGVWMYSKGAWTSLGLERFYTDMFMSTDKEYFVSSPGVVWRGAK